MRLRITKIILTILSVFLLPTMVFAAYTISQGGTNITSYTPGDIIYASSQYVLSKLGIGTDGYFLSIVSGIPAWRAALDLTSDQTVGGIKTFTSNIQTSAGDCTLDNEYCQKSFIEAKAVQPSRTAVRAITTSALPASTYTNFSGIGAILTGNSNGSLPAQDGVTLALGDRLLVKDQVNQYENGIYEVTGVGDVDHVWELTRSSDFDEASGSEVVNGAYTYSIEGNTSSTFWRLAVTSAITIGTTNLPFYQLNAASVYYAGDGLDLSGTLFGVDIKANDGLVITSTELTVDYDNSSIGITLNKLAVKALGITNAMLAGAIDLTSKVTGTLPSGNGGTGNSTYNSGQILIGNSSGGLTKNYISAGSNITITTSSGGIAITASSLGSGNVFNGIPTSTAVITIGNDPVLTNERAIAVNTVNLSANDTGANGSYTIDTVQGISVNASPTFTNLSLTGNLSVAGNATTTGEQYVNTLNFPLLTSNPAYKAGTLFYRQDSETSHDTLSFYDSHSGSILDIGEELWKLVRNCNSGATIYDGTAVYSTGVVVGKIVCVLPASATVKNNARVIGIATEDIANNQNGHLTTYGILNGLDTHNFTDGDTLYLSTSTTGIFRNLTNIKPSAPYYTVQIGEVDYAHPTQGKIDAQLTAPRDINDNASFGVTSPATNQLLTYDATQGFWKNVASIIVNNFTATSATTTNLYTTALRIDNLTGVLTTNSGVVGAVTVSGDGTLSTAGALAINKTRLNVRNETGTTIPSTRAVYVSGFNNLPLITLANNDEETKHNVVGITIAPITSPADGYIATSGQFNAETNGWVVGTELYLSVAGVLTDVAPTTGSVRHVAIVTVQANYPTGKLLMYQFPEENYLAGGTSTDLILRIGDTIGAKKASFRNYNNTEVASITSLGMAMFAGVSSTNATTTNLKVNSQALFPSGIWNSSGNVGIGTTTPTQKLQIYQNSTSGATVLIGDTDGNVSLTQDNGQFSIGNLATNGSVWLQANGNGVVYLNRYGGTGGMAVGDGGANIVASISSAGNLSLNGSITAATTLSGSAIGYNSSVTGDFYGIALGRQAQSITRGGIAIGYQAVATGTIAYSTAIGTQSNASGVNAIALGYLANSSGAGSKALGRISVSGDYSFGVDLDNSGAYTLSQANTMAIMGGNVGIGTVSPNAKLEVAGSTSTELRINVNNAIVNNSSTLNFYGNNGRSLSKVVGFFDGLSGNSGALSVYTNPTGNLGAEVERLRITSAGNVGIGTTTPTSKLTVTGDSYYSYQPGTHLWLNSATTPAKGLSVGYSIISGTDFGFLQAVDSSNGNNKNLILNGLGGNVGVGTTTPDSKLNVWGTLKVSTSTAGLATLYVNTANGRVGIGTNTPNTALEVIGTVSSTASMVNGNSTTTGIMTVGSGTSIGIGCFAIKAADGNMFYMYATSAASFVATGVWTRSLTPCVDTGAKTTSTLAL